VTELKSGMLDVPGAVLHYDIRRADAPTEPVLLIIGSPMGAEGFVTLAGHFRDRTVVTYDPRSAGRSQRTDGALETTVDEHADDLHRLIAALTVSLGTGPVDIFASSGGAVNALALVARHPEQVRTLVAHEPPSFCELPDSENVLAVCTDIHQTYQRDGFGPAMAKFIAIVSPQGPVTAGYRERAGPRPGDVRAAGRGRRLPGRPARRAEHEVVPVLPARLRRAPRRPDPRGHRRRGGVRRRASRPGGRGRRRAPRSRPRSVPW
jgi:pimeloyl-ACP methyl ester carboxylesterase